MERTMIALWGISNTGKTTTIRRVYDTLRMEGRVIDPGRPTRKEVRAAILEIDGVKVGFASPGDIAEILEENLEPLITAGCVVIVCATHTRGGTVETVRQFATQANPAYKLVWIKKEYRQTDHDNWNQQKAGEIIAEVRKAVSNTQLVEA